MHFDAYNYGVPGYGFVEVEDTIDGALAENGPFDIVVYTFNFNDIHPMTVGYLSLLKSGENRFATLDDYQGAYGSVKLFAKDHFKSFFVFRDLFANRSVLAAEQGSVLDAILAKEPPIQCYDDLVRETGFGEHRQLLYLWGQMYRDPLLIERLADRLVAMRSRIERGSTEFYVLVFYDFHIMEGDGIFFMEMINGILADAGVRVVDTYPLFKRNYRECDFYSDIGHPGKLGNRLISELALDHIPTH